MRITALALCIAAFALSGCDVVRMVFPHKPTPAEARSAIRRCGGSPDAMAWRVNEDGVFFFGEKTDKGPLLPTSLTPCLLRWSKWNRVKVGFIAWDPMPPS